MDENKDYLPNKKVDWVYISTSRQRGALARSQTNRDPLMLPLHEDAHFTFQFAEDRIIPRFHLEGVAVGRRVKLYRMDTETGEWFGLLAMATVGENGWVDLIEPIIVRSKEGFVVVPQQPC